MATTTSRIKDPRAMTCGQLVQELRGAVRDGTRARRALRVEYSRRLDMYGPEEFDNRTDAGL